MQIRSLRYAFIFIAAAMVACNSRVSEPTPGVYRAVLELPGGATPIGLEIAKEQERYVLYLSNGSERTRVPNVRVENSELIVVFPGYENSLRASMRRDALEGTITLIKAGGKEQVIPFNAQLGATHRFYADAAAINTDVAGRWEATFTSDAGKTSKAVAVLEQQRDRVTGTVMTPTGDHRFLEGQVRGDELQLSTFAGGLAYLYKLKLNPAGEFEGDYWQGLAEHVKVIARRNDAATLAGAGPQTTLKSEKFDFTFADVDGKPVSLSDERFRGKVVVVTLGGSWCPNCHDEAAFLAPFYREYRDKGFEIIALMFERHGAFEKAASAVRGYRNDLGIEFTTLIAGLSETEQASEALPGLSGVYGFPTTIFVDKKGVVRDIHVGFYGPATGKYHEEHVAAFRSQVDALLAETT